MSESVTIVECPRDAWQGLNHIIPTEEKIAYLSRLVSLGFTHIDAVSFVCPKHVPQMADSDAVMGQLSQVKTAKGESPEIIGIVVNDQGLERALAAPGVATIGYPYSISAYFRRADANTSKGELPGVGEIVEDALVWLKDVGVRTVSLADTIGTATPEEVAALYQAVRGCVAGV